MFWTQATMEDAVRNFFPEDWLDNEFLRLEELMNNEQVAAWRRHAECEVMQSMVSTYASCARQTAQALDKQGGGVHSKHQCTRQIRWGIEAEAAFAACISMVENGCDPWNHQTPVLPDLDFAAQRVISQASNFEAYRECTARTLNDLSLRC